MPQPRRLLFFPPSNVFVQDPKISLQHEANHTLLKVAMYSFVQGLEALQLQAQQSLS